MIRNTCLRAAAVSIGGALLSMSVMAAPVVNVTSAPDVGTTLPVDVANARTAFVNGSGFVASSEENFSSFTTPLTLSGGATLSVLGAGLLSPSYAQFTNYRVSSGQNAGRFDPTCPPPSVGCTAQFFEASGSFSVSFGGEYNGFGFFGTDIGDFFGKLQIFMLDAQGNRVAELRELIFTPADSPPSGGVLFYSMLDQTSRYSGADFVVTQSDPNSQDGYDFFGFDNLFVGRLADPNPNPVPEPGSLALVGASLLALTAARRRRGAHKA